jgi:hypothetical protein
MGIYEPHGDAKTFFHVSSKSQIKITHMQPNTHNLDCPQMAPITSYLMTLSGNSGDAEPLKNQNPSITTVVAGSMGISARLVALASTAQMGKQVRTTKLDINPISCHGRK